MIGFQINSVWVPLFPEEEESVIRLLVRNGLTLASWLGAHLYWMISEAADPVLRQWVDSMELEGWRNQKIRCSTLSIPGLFRREILKRVPFEQKKGMLLMNSDRVGFLGLSHGLSRKKLQLLKQTQMPVWIVPASLRMKSVPVTAVLVPMSGEKRTSEALELGIGLGNQKGVPVDVLHVTSSEPKLECDHSVVGCLSDQFHHEYPRLVDELIAQGSPLSSPRERQVIRDFFHCYGDVSDELKRRMRKNSEKLMIFEWKGSFRRGRAKKIRLLLRHASGPVLLIREAGRIKSHLKVGHDPVDDSQSTIQ